MSEPSSDGVRFEDALAELEQVVRDLEDGDTGLEQALARYEHGVGLLRHCYARLQEAEHRILLLTGKDEEGGPVTRPFEHAATLKPVRRRKRGGEEGD